MHCLHSSGGSGGSSSGGSGGSKRHWLKKQNGVNEFNDQGYREIYRHNYSDAIVCFEKSVRIRKVRSDPLSPLRLI